MYRIRLAKPGSRRPLRVLLAVVLLMAVALTAVGTAIAVRSGNDVAEAKRLVAKQSKPAKWKAPGPPVNVGTRLKGKTVYFLANGLNFPFVQDMLRGVKQAAAVLGMKVTTGDGAGSAAKAGQLIQQAVGQKVAVIIDEGFPDTQISAPLKAAKAAGVTVLEFGNGDPRFPSPAERARGVSAIATFCYTCAGREMVDLAIAQSNGKVDAVIYNVPGISVAPSMTKAIRSEFRRLCSSCKVKVVDAPLAQWSTLLPSLTTSAIHSDPNVNYLLPLFDSMFALIRPAVIQAGAADRVKMVSYNATLPGMSDLRAANQLVSGDVGGAPAWVGWGMMDQAVRVLTGHKAVRSENIPDRTFTPQNIKSINLKLLSDRWYGVNFAKRYRKLWRFH
jgi:ribose transport system substrate-binding protein